MCICILYRHRYFPYLYCIHAQAERHVSLCIYACSSLYVHIRIYVDIEMSRALLVLLALSIQYWSSPSVFRPLHGSAEVGQTQRHHVAVKYIQGPCSSYHIIALGTMHIPYSYLQPLGKISYRDLEPT